MNNKKIYIPIAAAVLLVIGALAFCLTRGQQTPNEQMQFMFDEPENFRGNISGNEDVPISELTWHFGLNDASVQLPILRELVLNNDEAGLEEFLRDTHNGEQTLKHMERFLATVERTPIPINVDWTGISYGRQGDSVSVSYDTRVMDDLQRLRYDFSIEFVGDSFYESLEIYRFMGAELVDVTERFANLGRQSVIAYYMTYSGDGNLSVDGNMFQAYFVFKIEDLRVRTRLYNFPSEADIFELLANLEFARGTLG
ncbi:MAG: hypothetical protein FWE06_02000 [Oscillospiraceae bacterium]|nr:hypothetical protein [Oscillospiraceae bacterium]